MEGYLDFKGWKIERGIKGKKERKTKLNKETREKKTNTYNKYIILGGRTVLFSLF